jgi:hypothetical protein
VFGRIFLVLLFARYTQLSGFLSTSCLLNVFSFGLVKLRSNL